MAYQSTVSAGFDFVMASLECGHLAQIFQVVYLLIMNAYHIPSSSSIYGKGSLFMEVSYLGYVVFCNHQILKVEKVYMFLSIYGTKFIHVHIM